jgi:hypothetical protein
LLTLDLDPFSFEPAKGSGAALTAYLVSYNSTGTADSAQHRRYHRRRFRPTTSPTTSPNNIAASTASDKQCSQRRLRPTRCHRHCRRPNLRQRSHRHFHRHSRRPNDNNALAYGAANNAVAYEVVDHAVPCAGKKKKKKKQYSGSFPHRWGYQ